jgi:hypothetical protein
MEFLITDIAVALAALTGYLAFVALERYRAQVVGLRRVHQREHSLP